MEEVAKQLMQELKEQREAHKAQMAELIHQMERGGAAARTPEVILREKQQSVFNNLMKCADLKSYKFTQQKTIREWLRAFDTKINIFSGIQLPKLVCRSF